MLLLPKSKSASPLGHSADVDLLLHTTGRTFSLSHTCSTALRLIDDIEVPCGPARVEIITDGVSNYSDVIVLGPEDRGGRWLKIQLLPTNPANSPE